MKYQALLPLLVALALVSVNVGTFAQDKVTPTGPVQISADNFVVDENTKESTFSGNVVITQPGMELLARIVVVHYGTGGPTDLKDLEATGNVKITTQGQVATGDRGTYDPNTKIFHLRGNVVVVTASGTVKSAELTVDLNKGTSQFSAPAGGRVTGTFTPSQ